MKILQIANKFPYPAKDGGSLATLSLGKSFAELGHDVTILAINTSKHYFDPEKLPTGLASAIRFVGVPVNTDIRFANLVKNFFFSKWPYNAERFISQDFRKELANLLNAERFDIIQLEGLYLAPYLDTIRSCSAARVVMRAHNIEYEIWERSISQQANIKKLYIRHLANRIKRMELHYLNLYNAILPITSRDGEMLKNLGCRLPMHVVPTGINAEELIPDYTGMEFPSVFHIGALDWMPNQEGLLWFFNNVWDKVLELYPDVRFYLAGRNAPAHFTALPYRNIVYLGEVEDAYEFMRSKAVMIVPVLSGSGMRIKIVEGMALGKAIVTTTIGTEGIATESGVNIMISDDPGGFALSVAELLRDYERYLEIGKNARKFVTDYYGNTAITRSLAAFYEKLL